MNEELKQKVIAYCSECGYQRCSKCGRQRPPVLQIATATFTSALLFILIALSTYTCHLLQEVVKLLSVK